MTNPTVRVRFAPSPTGYLHVGGVRTALFNWLLARKTSGKFLLRIEDTDRARSSDEHTQVILDGLSWLGLTWDEDVVFQGAGLERHQALAQQLLKTDHTYQDEGAIRFRMPKSEIAWDDTVHGRIAFQGGDIPDWVILRSDGTPTYNFSVVADDIDMRITHVVRGDDHISNTPKQLAVYQALGATPPLFGHVPNVHGPDGKKLSKRHGATAVGDYRDEGFLPAAMCNFLSLLGWNPGDDRELFYTKDELMDAWSMSGVQKKSAVFDLQKLLWMNGQHISQTNATELLALATPYLSPANATTVSEHKQRTLEMIDVVRARARIIPDVARQVAARLAGAKIEQDDKAKKLIAKDASRFRAALEVSAAALRDVSDEQWTAPGLDHLLRDIAEKQNMGLGQLMQPIRVALTGGTVSEPVNELLYFVGKEESLIRIDEAIQQPAENT